MRLSRLNLFLLISCVSLVLLVLLLPVDKLQYLSLNVVGEPPINGRTWQEGVEELGGALSMRLLAIWGVLIIYFIVPRVIGQESVQIQDRHVSRKEIATFFGVTAGFFIANLLIGYAWWDPDGFLGMGPLFLPSIASLVVLGIFPEIARKIFNFNDDGFFSGTSKKLKSTTLYMIIVAFGYGLISCIWHCCEFYEPKMYFFFFVIKLVQLWGMCSFFFKWGYKMLSQVLKNDLLATIMTALLFGFCYPWHTFGFALAFAIFGVLMCILTRKANSYIPGLILLYFAYIFHAGLPWHGPLVTLAIIHPIAILMVILLGIDVLRKRRS